LSEEEQTILENEKKAACEVGKVGKTTGAKYFPSERVALPPVQASPQG
jgi:hypothetical protein